MTDSLIGKQLDEYRLEKLLGQGGMARVYRGLDLGLQRYAAIKVIDTPHRQDEDYIARFEQEARAIAQLDHPHIVTVFRYGRAENVLYLAMRYIEGADLLVILDDYEKDDEIMPLAETTRLVREIGSALDYAHKHGVIHRDVKPSNVMLNAEGCAYLTDFGLALLTDVGTMGKILGSPQYIAPEQAVSSAGAVPQSDLYSLGVILFRMVTGRLPFEHEDVLELMMLHMTAETPDPREFRPEIGPKLAEVVLKAMAKESHDRYASGIALADALDAAVKDTAVAPVAAPTLSIIDRVALDMEMLPQVPAAVTPERATPRSTKPVQQAAVWTEEQTIDGLERPLPVDEPRPSKSAGCIRTAGAALFFLLFIVAAFYLYNVWKGADELPPGAAAVVTPETNGTDSAETPGSSLTGETTTAVGTDAASTDAPTPTLLVAEQASPSGEIYLPMVTGRGGQAVVVSTAASPTDTPPTVYQLLIVTNKTDSLFLVNQSAVAFPLATIRLENDEGEIEGTEWEVGRLQPGDCVTIRKANGNPKEPDVDCNEVGKRVTRSGPERFWGENFDVFYNGESIGVCDPKKECVFEITG